jgi:hypothetical protein
VPPAFFSVRGLNDAELIPREKLTEIGTPFELQSMLNVGLAVGGPPAANTE